MKKLVFSACTIALIIFSGCKHDPSVIPIPENDFDFNKGAGLWVPYEYIYNDTVVIPGPFTTMGIFGAYSESVEIKANKTFVPVIWFSASNIIKNEIEGGPIEYDKTTKRLLFTNPFGYKFVIRKFEGNQLWLDMNFGMYKLEKKG